MTLPESQVAEAQPRVPVAHPNLVAIKTIARREIARILRIWGQTLVPPAITMTLYFLIFGSLIGSRIGDMGGFSYMDFIVPGLVMMSVIQNAYGNISSSFFGAKFGRHVEELLVSPMPNWVILGGYVAGGVLRGLMVGAIVLVIAMFFTQVRIPHPFVTLTTVLLGATIFRPGICANQLSSDWLCCAPKLPTLPAVSIRRVIGTLVRPPDIYRSLAA